MNKHRINQIMQTLTIQSIKPMKTELICQTSGKITVSALCCSLPWNYQTRSCPAHGTINCSPPLPEVSVDVAHSVQSDVHFNKRKLQRIRTNFPSSGSCSLFGELENPKEKLLSVIMIFHMASGGGSNSCPSPWNLNDFL